MDRLVTGLKQTPIEAYYHIQHLLEQVSNTPSPFFVLSLPFSLSLSLSFLCVCVGMDSQLFSILRFGKNEISQY